MAAISPLAVLLGRYQSVRRNQTVVAADSYNVRHLLGASPERVFVSRVGAADASCTGNLFVSSYDATSVTLVAVGSFGTGSGFDIFCERIHSLVK